MAVGWTGPELYPKRLRQRASLVLTSGAAGKVTLLRAVCGVDCPTAGITPRVAASVRVTGGVVRGCARSGDDRDSPTSATDSLARRRAVLKLLHASELPEGSAKGAGLTPPSPDSGKTRTSDKGGGCCWFRDHFENHRLGQ